MSVPRTKLPFEQDLECPICLQLLPLRLCRPRVCLLPFGCGAAFVSLGQKWTLAQSTISVVKVPRADGDLPIKSILIRLGICLL